MTHTIAKSFAENEFEKYRKIRDQKYVSDFDKLMLEVEKKGESQRKDGVGGVSIKHSL